MSNRHSCTLNIAVKSRAETAPPKAEATGEAPDNTTIMGPLATWKKVRRAGVRGLAQRAIDEVQFRFDIFPGLDYQPLPWIGLHDARRGAGTEERWRAIEKSLNGRTINSALDIGCQVGYFCFAFAFKGVPTLGIEMNDRYVRIARYAARKIKCHKAAFCIMEVSRDTAALLPNVDVVLLLSVWHHWVRRNGLQNATRLLSDVWGKCHKVLFFETGEAETAGCNRPSQIQPSSDEWVRTYLSDTCNRSAVLNIGQTKAFVLSNDGTKKVIPRDLYMVVRKE